MRPSGRKKTDLREIVIQPNYSKNAEGSCLIAFGDTQVICTASVEEKTPPFLRNSGKGWVSAEYGMLPRATNTRTRREAKSGQSGRTHEIQRLIGRALRAGIDLHALGERQILIDCDVLQADGGTRCAAITGGWVALRLAVERLFQNRRIKSLPIRDHIAAVSCGIYNGYAILDMDYNEDSSASTDANFVMTGANRLIEIQASAEEAPFTQEQFLQMFELAQAGIKILVEKQKQALEDSGLIPRAP